GGLNGLDGFRAAFLVGDLLIRNHDSDVALSRESQERRETRKAKEVNASDSTSASRNGKLRARKKDNVDAGRIKERKKDIAAGGKATVKKRNDLADTNVRAKKRDDVANLRPPVKKKDDELDENNEKADKKKAKGFFLFRPFRMFRTSSSAR